MHVEELYYLCSKNKSASMRLLFLANAKSRFSNHAAPFIPVVHAPPVMAPNIVVEDVPMMRHYNRRMERYMNARYGTPFISGVGQISHSGMYGGSGYF